MAKRGTRFPYRVTYSHENGSGVADSVMNYDEAVIYARKYAAKLVMRGIDGEYGVTEVAEDGTRHQVALITTADIDEDEAADILRWA